MARPTGQKSRARRIPLDVDDAIQQQADRRGTSWADELRRIYTHPGTPAIIGEHGGTQPSDTQPQPSPSPDPPRRLGSFADAARDHARQPPTPLPASPAVVVAAPSPGRQPEITGTIKYVDGGRRAVRQLREVRCRCAKPSMSKTVTNLCTACGHIR